jgi:proteasome lid subunit RPN8/RPN11
VENRFHLQIPRLLYDRMCEQALVERPNECCGLLAGRRGLVEGKLVGQVYELYPLVNAAASPVEFLSEPISMKVAMQDIDRRRLEMLAIYHSHPTSEPVPSKTDLERNYSDEVANIIISLKDGPPRVRVWWLTEREFVEAEWECVEAEARREP